MAFHQEEWVIDNLAVLKTFVDDSSVFMNDLMHLDKDLINVFDNSISKSAHEETNFVQIYCKENGKTL